MAQHWCNEGLPRATKIFNHPECRVCEGTGEIRFVLWRGRYRTRLAIAQWFIAQREWKGAVRRSLGSSLYLKKGASVMRLDGFTDDEIATLLR